MNHSMTADPPPKDEVHQPAGSPPEPNQMSGGAPNPTPPGVLQKAWNLAAALAAFVADGCQTVSPEEYRGRLEICDTCDQREQVMCRACGCNITLKARGRTMACPLSKWP